MIDYGEFCCSYRVETAFFSVQLFSNDHFYTLLFGLEVETAQKTFKTEHWFDNKPARDRWMQFFI